MGRKQPIRSTERKRQTNPSRRTLLLLFVFVCIVLLANAIIGERGLMATRSAGVQADQLESDIGYLRRENQRLRELARRLRSDPAAIEEAARGDLGYLRRGEIVVIIKNGYGTTERNPTTSQP